jgi:hypothetical protein
MSKGNSKKINGRIIDVNFEKQALKIRPFKGRPAEGITGKPIRLYANDALFRDLVGITESAWLDAQTSSEGIFYVQGKVLMHFELPSRLDSVKAFDAVKYQERPR